MAITIDLSNYTASADGKIYEAYPDGDAPVGSRASIMSALGVDVNPSPTGTTYYLDNTHGSASDSNPGTSPSAPWLTLNKALTTLTAGDMVLGTGTYNHGADITPSNSGTVGNPIIYRAATPRGFVIDQQNTHDGFRLTTNSINYTVIDGLEIKNIQGNGGVFTNQNNIAIHVFNCHIHNVNDTSGGNCGGIRFDNQDGGVAFNNVIHDITIGGASYFNGSGIHGYGQDSVILAFNKVYNAASGITFKNNIATSDAKIFGNDIDADSYAIWMYSAAGGINPSNITNAEIYNNLFRGGRVDIEGDEHIPQSTGFDIRNNVFLDKGLHLDTVAAVEIYNNIFEFTGGASEADVTITTERRDRAGAGDIMSITYSDHNNFTNTPTFTTNKYAHTGGSAVYAMSLATWRAQSSGDGFNTILYDSPDGNSLTLAPNYDEDYLAQAAGLSGAGRNSGDIGLEYTAGTDWSES